MALTPEEVVNKHFSTTHLRRGYDEDEVDDFLDEVVAEFRRLIADNQDLGTKLDECRKSRSAAAAGPAPDSGRVAELEARVQALTAELDAARRDGGSAVQQELAAARSQVETLTAQLQAARAQQSPAPAGGIPEAVVAERVESARREGEQRARESEERLTALRAELDRARAANTDLTAKLRAAEERHSPDHNPDQAASVIALAQRLHDQHVQEGTEAHDRLVAEGTRQRDALVREGQNRHDTLIREGQARFDELVGSGQAKHDELVATGKRRMEELVSSGQTRHDQLISEATTRHHSLISEAEERRSAILGDLNNQQGRLKGEIADLQARSTSYRARLRSFMEKQLQDLDGDGVPDFQER